MSIHVKKEKIISVCMCPGKQHSFLPAWTLTSPPVSPKATSTMQKALFFPNFSSSHIISRNAHSFFSVYRLIYQVKFLNTFCSSKFPLIPQAPSSMISWHFRMIIYYLDLYILYLQSLLMDFIYCLHLKSGNPMKIVHRNLIPTDLYRFPVLTLRNCMNLVKLLNFSIP